MRHKVLIAGAGQLGSRYLQGLAKHAEPLDIWVHDPSEGSLERARQRWDEVEKAGPDHVVDYVASIAGLPVAFDLAVVATTADVRPALVRNLSGHSRIERWVLEKILAQSVAGVAEIVAAIGAGVPAWVNTPMHMWSLYRNLRERNPGNSPIEARFDGFRGLICNAIHYVDLVARWNGAGIRSVDTSGLRGPWYPAQRQGFFEADGTLALTFSDGSSLQMTSFRDQPGYRARVHACGLDWEISEREGTARSSSGEILTGAVEFQSQMTAPMVASIFGEARCALPTLAQSADQHTALLAALQAHWDAHMPDNRGTLPIT